MSKCYQAYLIEIRRELDRGDATEHTHRPALKTFIESLMPKIIATNEPSHTKVGAPDFNVRRDNLLIGHIECKDVDIDLKAILKTDQLKRYLANLPNLILTDYINFVWFREGKQIDKAHIARLDSRGRLKLDTEELPRLERLLINFLKVEPAEIGDPRKLAEEMARPARMIRDTIREIFAQEKEEGPLHGQLAAFQEALLPDLDPHDFADMHAQTIAYGLFAAKTEELVLDPKQFTWEQAFHHLPKSNPFLQSLFSKMMSPENREPRIIPWVEELAALLGRSDMFHILEDFGKKTRQEDPVVHFYETFLGAYDPKMKRSRGVYYTPEPVVSYIVRSIDHLLKTRFGKRAGLADESVYILDPACGTGSFLLEVVKLIRERVGQAGWNTYVPKYLLPRLYGFELLVAPYTIAHLKLGLYLKETGFEFADKERLGIFLTNTLEPEVSEALKFPFAAPIAEEGKRAQKVKSKEPIMVVLGNPPYSYESTNNGEWITSINRDYYYVDGEPLGERNPKGLRDDYVKFLRFAQWRIEQTGYGIVGMITNHGYIDNPTFPGMRRELMKSFNEIYILDLHGNTLKKERCPDGSEDQNVFDIKDVGVAISIWVKEEGLKRSSKVKHSDLWGVSDAKDVRLSEMDIKNTKWEKVVPRSPDYLFFSQDKNLRSEFQKAWKITKVFISSSNGFKTHRDHFSIAFNKDEITKRVKDLCDKEINDSELVDKYNLRDTSAWNLATTRKRLQKDDTWLNRLVKCQYRPFDIRYCLYGDFIMDRPREKEMYHSLMPNLGLAVGRQGQAVGGDEWNLITSGKYVADTNLFYRGGIQYFPLYLYPPLKKAGQQDMHEEEIKTRKPNLAPEFIAELEKKVKLAFIEDNQGDLKKTFGPEDVFYYIYAVLHSPTYRERYAEFLKIDFPHVPLTSSKPLFRKLVVKGKALTELHLMESDKLADPTSSKVDLNAHPELKNEVVKVSYDEKHKRVYINKGQHFSGVEPKVWNFHVGGYQVCHKWLKDRKGRRLNYDDITHYQKIVIALRETIKLMEGIDKAIGEWPIE